MRKKTFVLLCFVFALGAGCASFSPEDQKAGDQAPLGKKEEGLAWSSSDAPSRFSTGLEYELSKLPMQGKPSHQVWAGGYWPTYKDSLNHRWDGENSDSPAKKYEKAFGGTDLELKISKEYGVLSYKDEKACTKDDECDPGRKCAMRTGETSGYCVHTWVGICHGWAPAAALEPEPQREVTHNGVTFKINDLKALLSLFYTKVPYKIISLRCNYNDAKEEIKYDVYGRPTGSFAQCQDTNPGTYHVILTNYLGIKKQSFVSDRISDVQVWNHPITEYRITQKTEVTAQEANKLVATRFGGSVEKDKWHHYQPIPVKAGESITVQMSGDGDADLYVHFGAKPDDKTYTCRPYKDGTAETCTLTVPAGATEAYISVLGYANFSTYAFTLTTPRTYPTAYLFNNNASKFYHVKAEVDYITESESTTDGNLASRIQEYTRTDRYEYILEVDASGKIIGGEWLSSSKRNHPDFLWLPERLNNTSVLSGAMTYSNVKTLLQKASGPSTQPTHSWNGNASIVSYSSGTATGYGLTYDITRIHPTSQNNPVVFFQWELDTRDGERLKISAPGMTHATITYGTWSTRDKDRTYKEVALPFVLDPKKDGFEGKDGNWYVVRVAFAKKPTSTITVKAEASKEAASTASSTVASTPPIDKTHSWNGNASIVSYSSGTATGYGLTYDITRIHPTSQNNPVAFFQWEIDGRDGKKLKLSAPGMTHATITYGSWANRSQDKVHRDVALPFVVNPQADGLDTSDGSWYVVRVSFSKKPTSTITVKAEATP